MFKKPSFLVSMLVFGSVGILGRFETQTSSGKWWGKTLGKWGPLIINPIYTLYSRYLFKVGPLPVISMVITPLIGVITPVTQL